MTVLLVIDMTLCLSIIMIMIVELITAATKPQNKTDPQSGCDDCYIVEVEESSGPVTPKNHYDEATGTKCTNRPECNRRRNARLPIMEIIQRHLSGER